MLQIPKADVQIREQDPQEMSCIYFSLINQINSAQASQTPDDIQRHPQAMLFFSSRVMNED